MFKTYSAWILVAVLIIGAVTVPPALGATITTRGTPSCATWVNSKGVSGQENWPRTVATAWLIGFLSGIALDKGKNFLDGTDTDSLVLWVDNYCAANSLKNVAEAATVLSAELTKQKGL